MELDYSFSNAEAATGNITFFAKNEALVVDIDVHDRYEQTSGTCCAARRPAPGSGSDTTCLRTPSWRPTTARTAVGSWPPRRRSGARSSRLGTWSAPRSKRMSRPVA